MLNKKCNRCYKTKLSIEFDEYKPGLLRWVCKECYYEIRKSNKRFNDYQSKYTNDHRDYFKHKYLEWVDRNKNQATTNQKWTYFKRKYNIQNELCVVCKEKETEAHHFNYDDPYFIVWLCKKHHGMVKRKKLLPEQYIPYSKDYSSYSTQETTSSSEH